MLKSMTGYAFVERRDGELTVSAEIRSFNSRHLDIVLRLPAGYAVFEEKIKSLIASSMERGRLELRLGIQDTSETAVAYRVDLQRAQAYYAAACQLNDHLKLGAGAPCLEHMLGVSGLILPADNPLDTEAHWLMTEGVVRQALSDLDRMRMKEGDFIAQDLSQRLEYIEQGIDHIEENVADMVVLYRDRLLARVEALTRGVVEIDPARIAQEASILADRSDISEEIVRARSHVQQFRGIMASDAPAGRKLNFLLQEFNREFNTMGAKAGQAELAHVIVDIKSEIEKLREQVQNIE
ncbi:MAG: YicC family protein [Desulfobacteraceae bacterium]|jgi:uncharacterized protein (TIGR00255 family)